MMRYILLSVFIFAALAPQAAQAARFCMAGIGFPPQCIYDDIETCRRAIQPPNTSCIVNPEMQPALYGNSDYCLVTSQGISECIYTDRGQCNIEARRKDALCMDNTRQNFEQNPYRYDTRVQR